jgi:hypothetical protein
MSAPNSPVWIFLPKSSVRWRMNCSYNGTATSGRAERVNKGRLPFLVLAKRILVTGYARPCSLLLINKLARFSIKGHLELPVDSCEYIVEPL